MKGFQLDRFLKIQNLFFFGLLIGATIAFIWLINDFIMPLFWSVIFAIVFNPVQKKWLKIVKRKNIAYLLTLLIILIIIL